MAAKKNGRKASDLAPKAVKSKDARSVRGGAITGSQLVNSTFKMGQPPVPLFSQRGANKV